MSQTLTTPVESLEIAIPSFVYNLMDLTAIGWSKVDSGSGITGSVDETSICQNLIDWSKDDEMREEENIREVMLLVCPMKVLIRQGSELVISQT